MKIPAAVAIATIALAGGVDNAAAKSPACAKKGSKTVVSTHSVRVYSVANRDDGRNLYGCLRSNDRRQLLTRSFDDGYVTSAGYGHVRVAGRFVAWDESYTDDSCKADCPPDYEVTTYTVSVRDLKRRKTQAVDGKVDGRLVVTAGGAIAWTQNDGSEVVVDAYDGGGARELDRGAEVGLRSLRLKGSTVSWTNGGESRSAELKPRV
jgi:hypothetical protein